MKQSTPTIKIGKMDAALRQLRTAIELWFNEGDPVAVHALAFAAYEVIHAVSKKRNPYRRDLIFDSLVIKDEYRGQYNKAMKRHASFFKHASREDELDMEIEFDPVVSETFILYASVGRDQWGEPQTEVESAFLWWFQIHNPNLLTEQGRKAIGDLMPVEQLEFIRTIPKRQFLQAFRDARRLSGKTMTVRPIVSP